MVGADKRKFRPRYPSYDMGVAGDYLVPGLQVSCAITSTKTASVFPSGDRQYSKTS